MSKFNPLCGRNPPRGSWFIKKTPTLIHSTCKCFYTSFGFSGQMVFVKIFLYSFLDLHVLYYTYNPYKTFEAFYLLKERSN